MLKKIDAWLCRLPAWLGSILFFAMLGSIIFICFFLIDKINYEPVDLDEVRKQYSLLEVLDVYPKDEIDDYVFHFYDISDFGEYENITQELSDIDDELRDYTYYYENSLEVISDYVSRYGKIDGYDQADFIMDGYEESLPH